MKTILKAAAALGAVFLLLVGVIYMATKGPVDAADEFVEHVRSENYSYAYHMLHPVVRKKTSQDQFVRTIKGVTDRTGALKEPSWGARNISTNFGDEPTTAEVQGSADSDSGREVVIDVKLVDVDDSWLIYGFWLRAYRTDESEEPGQDMQVSDEPESPAVSNTAYAEQGTHSTYESSREESEAPAPVETRYRYQYVERSVSDLPGHVQSKLRVHTANGRVREGYLVAVSNDQITLRHKRRSGSMDMHVSRRDIRKAEVLSRVSY